MIIKFPKVSSFYRFRFMILESCNFLRLTKRETNGFVVTNYKIRSHLGSDLWPQNMTKMTSKLKEVDFLD